MMFLVTEANCKPDGTVPAFKPSAACLMIVTDTRKTANNPAAATMTPAPAQAGGIQS